MEINKLLSYTKNINVLFAEDDEDSREEIVDVLKKFFKNVIIAEDGIDGIEKFKNNPDIELIITDINMPRLNGLDMIIKIKNIKPDINSIILSAYNETEYFINAILMGINGFLLKPFILEQFISTLQQVYKDIDLQQKNKQLQLLLRQYQDIVDEFMIVCKFDKNRNMTYQNQKFIEVFGNNSDFCDVFYDENLDEIYEVIENKQTWKGILKSKINNNIVYSKIIIKPILNGDKIVEFFVLFTKVGNVVN